jgi:ABC-type transporter Mla MlaB component
MNLKLEESIENNSLSFAGNLTIEHAAELQTFLMESLNRRDRLHLVFENVTEVDISFLQLLCSAHRTAVKTNKTLMLDGHRPEPLRLAVIGGGFGRQEGCVLDVQQTCIWKEGWR